MTSLTLSHTPAQYVLWVQLTVVTVFGVSFELGRISAVFRPPDRWSRGMVHCLKPGLPRQNRSLCFLRLGTGAGLGPALWRQWGHSLRLTVPAFSLRGWGGPEEGPLSARGAPRLLCRALVACPWVARGQPRHLCHASP